MRNYELTIVLDKKASAAKKKAVIETIEKIIKVFAGEVGTMLDWGEKENGIYLHFPVKLNPTAAKQIADKMKTEDDIIRYLLVKAEK